MNLAPVSMAAAALLLAAGAAQAADAEAGKARAMAVCAACHGANGVSVGDSIPNLAGQRAAYLETQLRAWKSGTRKNPLMNAIGAQLSDAEIPDLAAFFASLPAAGGTKSAFMPSLARTPLAVPEGYRNSYTKYFVQDNAEGGQVRHYYANPAAVAAAKAGKALPDGSAIIVEVYAARMDADKKPQRGADGHLVPERQMATTMMAREAGWGQAVPELLRNENWNYAVFDAARQPRATVNQAECLACHKPQDKTSYIFTLEQLNAAAAQAR